MLRRWWTDQALWVNVWIVCALVSSFTRHWLSVLMFVAFALIAAVQQVAQAVAGQGQAAAPTPPVPTAHR